MRFNSIRGALHKVKQRLRLLRGAPGSLAITSANVAQLRADFGELRQQLLELNEAIIQKSDAVRDDIKREISAELGFSFHDQAERISAELGFGFRDQAERIASRMNSLETFLFESNNMLSHLNTSLNARIDALDTIQVETKNIVQHVNTSVHSRLDVFENEMLPAISNQIHEVIAAQFNLFGETGNREQYTAHPEELYRPANKNQWDASLKQAAREFGNVYPLWKERLDVMLGAFRQTKDGNAAWAGDVKSRVFRGLVERYARGRALDVGCGVFGRPYYLSSYPADLVSGLDPLEPEEMPDFEFVRGISEYLPWPDASFSTVVSATSLDHCLSLDRSLAEMQRVLRPQGCLLLWIDSIPGAPKYEPDDPKFVPSDQYHLFHFDVHWFEPMLIKAFKVVDRLVLQRTGFISVMYCLERR